MLFQPPIASTIIMGAAYPPGHLPLSAIGSLTTRQIYPANMSIIRRAAVEHNTSRYLSMQFEITGDYFPIPFCGVDRNAVINGRKKI